MQLTKIINTLRNIWFLKTARYMKIFLKIQHSQLFMEFIPIKLAEYTIKHLHLILLSQLRKPMEYL